MLTPQEFEQIRIVLENMQSINILLSNGSNVPAVSKLGVMDILKSFTDFNGKSSFQKDLEKV